MRKERAGFSTECGSFYHMESVSDGGLYEKVLLSIMCISYQRAVVQAIYGHSL